VLAESSIRAAIGDNEWRPASEAIKLACDVIRPEHALAIYRKSPAAKSSDSDSWSLAAKENYGRFRLAMTKLRQLVQAKKAELRGTLDQNGSFRLLPKKSRGSRSKYGISTDEVRAYLEDNQWHPVRELITLVTPKANLEILVPWLLRRNHLPPTTEVTPEITAQAIETFLSVQVLYNLRSDGWLVEETRENEKWCRLRKAKGAGRR